MYEGQDNEDEDDHGVLEDLDFHSVGKTNEKKSEGGNL